MGIIAGIIIAICSIIYTTVDNNIIGALLFSLGLCVIVTNKYKLYTGQIGYINKENWQKMVIILLDNIIGVSLVALIGLPLTSPELVTFVNNKLTIQPFVFFIKSIFCGCLMYFAVSSYKKNNNLISVVLCIMGFILGKFEHCIADLAYFMLAKIITIKSITYFTIAVVGNTLGSKMINILEEKQND